MGWAALCKVYEILASRFVRQAHQTPIAHLHWHNDGAEGGSIRVSEPDLDGMPRPYITTFNTKTMHFAFVKTSMENWCIYFPGTSGSSFLYGFFLRVLFCASRRGAFLLSFLSFLLVFCLGCFRFCASPSAVLSFIRFFLCSLFVGVASASVRRDINAPLVPP